MLIVKRGTSKVAQYAKFEIEDNTDQYRRQYTLVPWMPTRDDAKQNTTNSNAWSWAPESIHGVAWSVIHSDKKKQNATLPRANVNWTTGHNKPPSWFDKPVGTDLSFELFVNDTDMTFAGPITACYSGGGCGGGGNYWVSSTKYELRTDWGAVRFSWSPDNQLATLVSITYTMEYAPTEQIPKRLLRVPNELGYGSRLVLWSKSFEECKALDEQTADYARNEPKRDFGPLDTGVSRFGNDQLGGAHVTFDTWGEGMTFIPVKDIEPGVTPDVIVPQFSSESKRQLLIVTVDNNSKRKTTQNIPWQWSAYTTSNHQRWVRERALVVGSHGGPMTTALTHEYIALRAISENHAPWTFHWQPKTLFGEPVTDAPSFDQKTKPIKRRTDVRRVTGVGLSIAPKWLSTPIEPKLSFYLGTDRFDDGPYHEITSERHVTDRHFIVRGVGDDYVRFFRNEDNTFIVYDLRIATLDHRKRLVKFEEEEGKSRVAIQALFDYANARDRLDREQPATPTVVDIYPEEDIIDMSR